MVFEVVSVNFRNFRAYKMSLFGAKGLNFKGFLISFCRRNNFKFNLSPSIIQAVKGQNKQYFITWCWQCSKDVRLCLSCQSGNFLCSSHLSNFFTDSYPNSMDRRSMNINLTLTIHLQAAIVKFFNNIVASVMITIMFIKIPLTSHFLQLKNTLDVTSCQLSQFHAWNLFTFVAGKLESFHFPRWASTGRSYSNNFEVS